METNYIFIDREDSSQTRQLIRETILKIQRGSSMIFFAERTRSNDGAEPYGTGTENYQSIAGTYFERIEDCARPVCTQQAIAANISGKEFPATGITSCASVMEWVAKEDC
jgi:1-acyl-sn-glycerol-3-phosphate acyltransferase